MQLYVSMSNFKKTLTIGVLTIAIGIFGFFGLLFSTCIGEFPWGNYDAYVIWEPVVFVLCIPSIIVLGFLFFLLNRDRPFILFSFLIYSMIMLIPSGLGFDSNQDYLGRWSGFLVGLLGIIYFIVVLLKILGNGSKELMQEENV